MEKKSRWAKKYPRKRILKRGSEKYVFLTKEGD
jgi:hypothetical protein|nr:MAG TPA: hypothetical protein [Crassvirales sp.]